MNRNIKTDFNEMPGFRIWHGEPPTSMTAHWHDQIEINYAVGGSLTYLLAGSEVQLPPGRLSLFWAGMPHGVMRRTEIERFYWIYIPLAWVLRLGLSRSFIRRLMTGEMIVDVDPLEEDRVMLDRWSGELPDAELSRRQLIIREVETRIIRLALAQIGKIDEHVPYEDGQVRKLTEMARFIAENYARPLRSRDVARHVGLHRNYAMTLFSRHYGLTFTAYLTRLRVSQAQYLLISTDLEVSRIAFETGFGSISRFYETFKAMTGHTPGQYRTESSLWKYGPESPFNPCSGYGQGMHHRNIARL